MSRNLPRIVLKTAAEVARIRRPAGLLYQFFGRLHEVLKPGLTTRFIRDFFDDHLSAGRAVSAQTGYRGFPSSLCTSVNHVAAHGIPGGQALEDGDLLTVDVTLVLDGWHADAAWTYIVGRRRADLVRLVRASWKATMAGIQCLRPGRRLGDVGYAIQRYAATQGYAVIEDFAGHGIGEAMHEDPIIANSGAKGTGPAVVPGLVVTVEPILSEGKGGVKVLEDGWTAVTSDGSLSAQFEHTVAVFRDRTEVLTMRPNVIVDEPPFF